MAQLREFDLELADVRARALGEDVEYEAGPVDDAAAERALEVALLGGAQRVVEDDQLGAVLLHGRTDLLELS